jgi:hypothetical protein
MAKKSRHARKKTARKVSRAVVGAQEAQAPGAPARGSVAGTDRQEYAYVVADIRQVAMLAAAMFVLLVGLSFFVG